MSEPVPSAFSEMQNSFFSFEAYTKLWVGLASKLPANMSKNPETIRKFLMTPDNPSCDEITLTGRITIHRGIPERDAITNRAFIPMSVVDMDEVGYAKSIDTTIRVTADFTKPNFGYTYQAVASSLTVPAEARMLMTLRFEGVGGAMADQLNAARPTVAKEIAATVHAFPFTNGAAIFQHVGNAARPILSQSGDTVGYLAHGIMIPQLSLGAPIAANPKSAARFQFGRLPTIPQVSATENEFLMGRAASINA